MKRQTQITFEHAKHNNLLLLCFIMYKISVKSEGFDAYPGCITCLDPREWLTSNQPSEHKALDERSTPQCDKTKKGTQMNCDEYSICLQSQIYEQKEEESN